MKRKIAALVMVFCAASVFGASWNANWNFPVGLRTLVLPLNVPLPHSINASGTSGGPSTGCSVLPALPTGLTVALSGGTCKISGTPTASVAQTVYSITSTTSSASKSIPETLTVTPVTDLRYTQVAANYAADQAIDTNLASLTGSAPDGFAVTSGSLPTGLSLNAVTGAITGTPTVVTPAADVVITATNGVFSSSATLNIGVQTATPYAATWSFYKNITYTPSNLNANVGNYPVLVKLNNSSFDFDKSTSDISVVPSGTNYTGPGGGDIRFTRADGVTDLPFQIERWDGVNKVAEIWVLVPSVSSSSPTTLRMFFGKTGQTTTSSANAVFSKANNFQAVWHMNAGSGNEIDASENGFTATAQASPPSASSLLGLGRSFVNPVGGISGHYFSTTATSVTGFQQNGHYSVSAWVNVGAVASNNYYTVIQKHDRQFSLQINNGFPNSSSPNAWESAEYNGDSGGGAGATPYGWQGVVNQNPSFATSGIHYITGQHDGFFQRLYVDGTLIYNNSGSGFGSSSPGTTAPTLTNAVAIGRQSEAASRYWNGDLDEIRMHSVVRDSNFIRLDYQTQLPGGTALAYAASIPTDTTPPGGLTYSTNPAVYSGGVAITDNVPTVGVGSPTSWSIVPALPSGLSFNTLNGKITGTPAVVSSATHYLVTASNIYGSDTETVTITVNGVAPSAFSYSDTSYLFGAGLADSSVTPTANNGGLAITYTSNPALPAGLHLDSLTGKVSGTPVAGLATADYLITAANAQGTATATLNITVLNPILTFHYSRDSLTLVKDSVMTADSEVVTGTAPFTPVKFFVAPVLPAGLSLDSLTGILSGTPTVSLTPTSYVITAKNGIPSFDLKDTLVIAIPNAPMGLSYSPANPVYEEGTAIATNVAVPSGTAPFLPLSYAISSGVLPPGLILNADGTITGTPNAGSAAGSPYPVVVTASNVSGSAKDTLSITVLAAENYSGWLHSKDFTLNASASGANITTDVANFPVLIRLNASHLAVFQQAAANGADIRFTNSTGGHLSYQIDRWSFTPGDTSAAIWVLADQVTAGISNTVRMFWGNGSATDRSNGSNVFSPSNGYLGVWHMGNPVGDPQTTVRPNAALPGTNDAAPVNFTPTHVPKTGAVGMADTLERINNNTDGTSDYFSLGNGFDNFNGNATLSMWVYPVFPVANQFVQFVAIGNGAPALPAGNNTIWFGRRGSGTASQQDDISYEVYGGNSSGGRLDATTTAGALVQNQWQYVSVTLSGVSKRIFRNGVSVAGPTNSTQALRDTMRTRNVIGWSDFADATLRGMVDEVRVSKVARSVDWVSLEYTTQTIGVTPVFNLSHSAPTAVYMVGTPVTVDTATLMGNATTWSVSPALPSGLTLSGTGNITGTPTAITPAADYLITAKSGNAWTVSDTVHLTVNPAAPSGLVYSSDTVVYRTNEHILPNSPALADNGGGGITYSVSPSLPTGLNLDPATGVITGIPVSTQSAADYVVTAMNSAGPTLDTVTISITASEDYSVWTNVKTLAVNTAASGLASGVGKFPLLVRLTSAHAAMMSAVTTNGADLRFSEPGGIHLPYQIEHWSIDPSDTSAAIWVLVDTISANGTTSIRMHWGNGLATSDSRPKTVFSASNGFEAVYHFAETGLSVGDTSVDATGNGHTATAAISGGSVPGDAVDGIGVSKTFAGTNTSTTAGTGGYFLLADPNIANSGLALNTKNGPWTISAWVKPTSCSFNTFSSPFNSGRYAVLSKYNGPAGGQKAYFFGGNNANNQWKVNYIPSNLTTGSNEMSNPTSTCSVGQWQFLTASYESAVDPVAGQAPLPSTFTVTLNGSQTGTPSAGANTTTGNGASVRIGASDDNARFMNGSIDEVVVSKTKRSVDWEAFSYASQKPGVATLFDLNYSVNSPVYQAGTPITPDTAVAAGSATSFSISPALPTGLSIDANTGIISGTATVAISATNFTVTATNNSLWSTSSTVNITVNPEVAPTGLSYQQNTGVYIVGTPITPDTATVTGAVNHYSVSPALPAGLVLDTLTSVISGTPTTNTPQANYIVSAVNSGGSATDTLTITVYGIPSGLTYSKQAPVYATGSVIVSDSPSVTGTVTHYAVAPTLPAALVIDSITGIISGTPASASPATAYVVTASNPAGSTTDTVTITVLTPPSNLTYAQTTSTYGVGVTITPNTPSVTGTVSHYAVAPALPSGLVVDSLTGVISGTPTSASAQANYVVTASNAAASTTDTLYITVLAAPTSLTYAQQNPVYAKDSVITPNTPSVTGTVTHYSVAPNLPAGLLLDSTTGVISGTPTAVSASAAYVVSASNLAGATADTLNITVAAAPIIAYTHGSISGMRGVAIVPDTALSTGGAVTVYSVLPPLPSGLVLDSLTGLISGTPTVVSASASYTVTATGLGGMDTALLNITVVDTTPVFTYAHPTSIYSKDSLIIPNTVISTGGSVTVYHVAPPLPTGLSLDSASGAISGTPTVTSSATDYTVTGTGSGGNGTATVNITVLNTVPPPVVAYKQGSPTYIKHVAISPDSIISSGGPVSHFSVAPALPAGLILDTISGIISGTPSAVSASTGYSVIASGSGGLDTALVTITVQDTTPSISYKRATINGVKNVAILADTVVVLGTGAIASYSVAPSLPAGLNLDTLTGVLSGTPTAASTSAAYTITATGPGGSGGSMVTIAVADTAPAISYKRATINGVKNTAILADTVVILGTGAITGYSVNPVLPVGLHLDSLTGVISGTPTGTSVSTGYLVTATGPGGTGLTMVTVAVVDVPPSISYSYPVISAVKHVAIAVDSSISTGGAITSFHVSPLLPAGIVIDTLSGFISGTPSAASASTSYTVTATGPGGVGTANVTIAVADTAPSISYKRSSIAGVKNIPILSDTVVVLGTGAITSYHVAPALPAGLSLDSLTGRISGMPTTTSAAANYTVSATGPGGVGTSIVNIAVTDTAPSIAYKRANITGVKNVAILPDTVVLLGSGAITSYHVAPVLPAGLLLDSLTGRISGTPSLVSAAANYTVSATGPGGVGTSIVNIAVTDTAPAIAYKRDSIAAIKSIAIVPDTVVVKGTGAIASYSVAPALPAGLLLDSLTGRISGTGTAASAAANYTITATGPGGAGTSIVNISVADSTPVIAYRHPAIAGLRGTAILPDTIASSGGSVSHYAVAPALPAGLVLDSLTGRISGTPTVTAASANYVVTGTGFGGSDTANVVIIVQEGAPSFSYKQPIVLLKTGVIMTPDTVATAGGLVTHYLVNPALPAGLILDSITGLVSGTPTAASASANYVVTGTGPGGFDTASLTITVNTLPVITVNPTPQTLLLPTNTAKFFVTVTGTAPFTYKWIRTRGSVTDTLTNAGIFTGATTDTLRLNGVTLADTNSSFKCLVTNVAGSAQSSSALLSVLTVTDILHPHVVRVHGMNTFAFRVPTSGVSAVQMTTQDMKGHLVWKHRFELGADRFVSWDGTGMDGYRVSSGMYIVRLKLLGDGQTGQSIQAGIKR